MFAIVIVHWNTPDLLDACLQSIEGTSSTVVEDIIVVDCASDEGSAARIAERYRGTRLVCLDENRGFAAGCNAGYQEVSSPSVLFLNADVALAPGALDALARCFDLNPRIGLVAPLLLNADGSVQSAGYRFPGFSNVAFDLLPLPDRLRGSRLNGRISPGNFELPYAVDYALGAAVAIRSEALNEVCGWNEEFGMYSEEIDLCRRLDDCGWTRLIEPRARATHFGGASTSQRPVEMEHALWRSRGRYHRRWSTKLRQAALFAMVKSLTRLNDNRGRGSMIRTAFRAGLRG
jgi:N-acetylglucosaminyl-diphospho-decaprenol L-rhamnosyltransferase